ncbi:adenosylmethionine--8-amino-7-oxononanoate transaminase [Botrimarina mediterranea]|uniref:Adenosylmethionine-8-amino-7-oxononanoate aminotransferase n=1 Tax=Botrimarina mediterranea TaxID=2528022 RepID=A0A518KC37_9BACT|nr:adenosylmethionine--8-amino-7-oxononanoate transaminase [Botrimarina mediterranea]QDV75360.1 Adenosylmethionine-8-amino-7-oxononanoate aminotransferase [Botrimarina mediterranea]
MNSSKNDQLREWDRAHYWHSFTPMAGYEPLVIARAEGSTLYDVDGNAYLDAASSMWCAALGHGHPRINAAIVEQLGKMAHCTSLGMGADIAVRLAKRLADLAPGDLQHVFYSSDGSSAVEVAMKQALQYWRQCDSPRTNKTKYLAFGQAYHGDTIGATALGGIGRYHDAFAPVLCEVIRVAAPDSRSAKSSPLPGGEGEMARALSDVRTVLESQADTIAAIVVEPRVQCAAGMLMHPPGFLAGLRKLCDEYDVLLVADEIAVGLGRTGKLFACNHEDVTPDFLCLGKHLTAGYLPMAVTITTPRVYNAFLNREPTDDNTFWHGHTHSGNALAAAAAMATLDEFESGLMDELPAKIAHLNKRWREIATSPRVKHSRQCGMIAAIDLHEPKGQAIASYALERGVWLRGRDDLVYVMPPLNIDATDLDRILDVVAAALQKI